jgi:phytoene dehydrogenase-like protein
MSSKYDAIIIGAGIGGLACGNILAKNGLKVLILEKNHVPGGAVTTFYRKGYPVDVSHALCAVKEGGILKKVFDYLSIYDKLEFVELDKSFIYIDDPKKEPIYCYAAIAKYQNELKNHFPDEAANIDRLFNKMDQIWENEILKSYYAPSFLKLLTYPFAFPNLFKYRNYTFGQFIDRFINNFALKEVVSAGWPYLGLNRFSVSALYMIATIMAYHKQGTFSVRGGIGKLSEVLASNFRKLSGDLGFNTKIKKIMFNNTRTACAVQDQKGNTYIGKRIISNVDTKKTYMELIDKDFLPKKLLRRLNRLKMSCTGIEIHLFSELDLDSKFLSAGSIMYFPLVDFSKSIRKHLSRKAKIKESSAMLIGIERLKDYLPNTSNNQYLFKVGVLADSDLWEEFFNKSDANKKATVEKETVGLIIRELKKVFAIQRVTLYNVVMPFSLRKWLNSTKGAIYDCALTPSQALFNRKGLVSEIKNLHLVGAKTFPGNGIVGALSSAVALSDIILDGSLTQGKFVLN